MFNNSLSSGKMKRAKRLTWLTLPFSLLLHALVIAGLVVVPLLRADVSLPKYRVITISTTPPVTPLVPSKGSGEKNGPGKKLGGGKQGGGGKAIETKNHSQNPIGRGKFIIPIAVPETIEDENWSSIGVGNGESGYGNGGSGAGGGSGIPEGFEDGDPEALIGKDETTLRIASVQMPRKIREIKPIYSSIALKARVQGRVVIEAMTDIYGRVRSARIISSASPLLNEEALQAVKQWLYEPYFLNGIPKPVVFTVTITFTLAQ